MSGYRTCLSAALAAVIVGGVVSCTQGPRLSKAQQHERRERY
jgi:hypothetical protein